MAAKHIFGDIEGEAGRGAAPAALFVHPKAEGLFGVRRAVRVELGPARPAEAREEEALISRH